MGAGPYGLSVAAHAQVAGIPYMLFGEPLAFWKKQMLADMQLRSPIDLTSLSHPAGEFSLGQYLTHIQRDPAQQEPVSKAVFLDYGAWFQQQIGIEASNTGATWLRRADGQFLVETMHQTVRAAAVVVATGLTHYQAIPALLTKNLPITRYAHSTPASTRRDYARQRVLVVGGGQSAFELALYAQLQGAQVTLAQRAESIYYADIHDLLSRLFISLLSNSPMVFHHLPDSWHDPLRKRMLPTTVAPWIEAQLQRTPVQVWCGAELAQADETQGAVHVTFRDGRSITVDQIIAATGYKVDLSQHLLLGDPSIRDGLVTHDGAPHLDRHYQSTIPGLFFAGAMAQHSFGPAYNFIFGVGPQCRAMVDAYLAERLSAHAGR
ncbi:MAG TPA: NAD(P)-binding domain-containing protein [Herpetosiphonaceae bacterium]